MYSLLSPSHTQTNRVHSQDRNYLDDYNNDCANVNQESKSFYVRFDDQQPAVTVTLGTFLDKKSADGRKYEDIPLTVRAYAAVACSGGSRPAPHPRPSSHNRASFSNQQITVNDNCDPNPEVTITVFSDETTVTHEFDDKPAAVLERKYSNVGPNSVLQGWGLTLDRYSYAKKLCGPHMECYEADGRYYIVRGG